MNMKSTIEEVATALKKTNGAQTRAAEALGITYPAIWQRIKGSKYLQELVKELRNKRLDIAEAQLDKNVKAGKEASIFFILKCLGKDRGYVERQEVSMETTESPVVRIYLPENNRDVKKTGLNKPGKVKPQKDANIR